MNAPTLYFLKCTQRSTGEYEIWEQHMCQEKGCIKTEPQFVDLRPNYGTAKAFVDAWITFPPLGGKVENVEWEHHFKFEKIDINDFSDDKFCGTYSDLRDMIVAMSELSNLKPYSIINEKCNLQGYTFEVVE